MGELQHEAFQFAFNGFLKVAFQGSRITSDAGLLLVPELDERLGLATLISEHLDPGGQNGNSGQEASHRVPHNGDVRQPSGEPAQSRQRLRAGALPVGIVAALVLVGPAALEAQENRRVEVSVGYAAIAESAPGDGFSNGIVGSATWRLADRLRLVGEVSWSSRREEFASIVSDRDVIVGLVGARVILTSAPRVTTFGELLVGPARQNVRISIADADPDDPFASDLDLITTDLAWQLGGGLLGWFHPRLGAQAVVHYRRTINPGPNDLPDVSEWRLSMGLTFGF